MQTDTVVAPSSDPVSPQFEEAAASQRMQCMEIWGGNRATHSNFEAPGIDVHVLSQPCCDHDDGGDIYYLTSCASGRISRMLLADVSGHGETASKMAIALRDVFRRQVNRISQKGFVEEMNREFSDISHENCFATAAVATFFEPRKRLTLGLAGHPYPLYYSATRGEWRALEPNTAGAASANRIKKSPRNLPLGVLEESTYPSIEMKTAVGDMLLLYSDAFIEGRDDRGQVIGTGGLLKRVAELDVQSPANLLPTLKESLHLETNGQLATDDATLILAQFTRSKVRWQDNLLAPFRMFRKPRDTTELASCCA